MPLARLQSICPPARVVFFSASARRRIAERAGSFHPAVVLDCPTKKAYVRFGEVHMSTL